MQQTGIFAGRTEVRCPYARWGWTRGGGKVWHGGIDLAGLDDATIRMPYYKGKRITGRVTRARIVTDRRDKTWEWGYYVCVQLDRGQTPDAVNFLYFAHCASLLVKAGQRVASGDALAVMGNTGNAALADPPYRHCHLEVRAAAGGVGLDPTIDFIKPVIAPKMDEKKQILIMRIMLVMFVAVSAVIAIVQYSSRITFIAQLMGVSWGAIAGAFLAPFLYGLYWKKTTVAACWTCFVWGTGIMTLNFISNTWGLFKFPAMMQSPINCGAVAMVGGLIIVPIVSLFTKKPDQKKVEEAFSCYEETVTVAHRKALD